jgi:pimeloyl-ACP methyl ester carboxylesterase
MAPKPWIIATALVTLSLPVAAAVALGQKMTAWKEPKKRDLTISADCREVTLQADPRTRAPGTYGLLLPGVHVVVGAVVSENPESSEVTREIIEWTGPLAAGAMRGSWTGQAIAAPEKLNLDYEEVSLGAVEGELPAWIFHPANPSPDVWAIHIHGLRSSRYSMLRSVESATNLGMTSLVPSYFGDAENHAQGQVCHYGSLEANDVEKALAYAAEHGAKAIYLFGWSMGATISLLLTETSKWRPLIAGLVLVSPGPNTEAVIAENARTAGLPRMIATLVPKILSAPLLSRLASLTRPVDFENLNWTNAPGRLRVPALVLHSRGDAEVPYVLSEGFAKANPGFVTLKEFPAVPHQCEWNALPERFEDEVSAWFQKCETSRVIAGSRRMQHPGRPRAVVAAQTKL